MKTGLLVLSLTLLSLSLKAQMSSTTFSPSMVVEIRTYTLKSGMRNEFHKITSSVIPMLERWNINVVAIGPSLHDDDSYFLIRSFDSLQDREQKEEAFYTSNEWIHGPRDSVLACIENYITIVIPADQDLINKLKLSLAGNDLDK